MSLGSLKDGSVPSLPCVCAPLVVFSDTRLSGSDPRESKLVGAHDCCKIMQGGREKVKATARELSKTMKEAKLVLDWRKRQQARADVRVTIEKVLDQGLPRAYTLELFEQKTSAVFQHVYEAYYGAGRSAYTAQ